MLRYHWLDVIRHKHYKSAAYVYNSLPPLQRILCIYWLILQRCTLCKAYIFICLAFGNGNKDATLPQICKLFYKLWKNLTIWLHFGAYALEPFETDLQSFRDINWMNKIRIYTSQLKCFYQIWYRAPTLTHWLYFPILFLKMEMKTITSTKLWMKYL